MRNVRNQELIQKVVRLVHEERRIGVEILELLLKIEQRKAYSDLGYDGLFSFCVKELKYSEAQAMRRIQAMRAMRDLPVLKEKIQSGALTVTTVSQVQTHLRKQKQNGEVISPEQKLELFASMQNQSAKEVEKNLERLEGKDVSVKLVVELDDQMSDSWNEIKNLSAHSTRGDSAAILEMLMQEWLKRNDPKRKKVKDTASTELSAERMLERRGADKQVTSVKKEDVRHGEQGTSPKKPTRYIPAKIRRFIWMRDQGRCTRCKSTFALQFDHITPFAHKGSAESQNLRLLCRSCNLAEGIRVFGPKRMKRLN